MTRTGGCARRTWFPRQVSAEARTQILADGPEHVINAVAVRVHPFHRRSYAEVSDAEDVDEGAVARGSHQNDPIEDASASEVTALYKTYAMGVGAELHHKHAKDADTIDETEEDRPHSDDVAEVPEN